MNHTPDRNFSLTGYYEADNTLNWVFDVGDRTIMLQQGPRGAPLAHMWVKVYKRQIKPLPPKPYMWLGAEADA